MNKIELKPPIIIKKLESIMKRVPKTHQKQPQITERHRRFKSGFNGEQSLKFFYRYLPKEGLSYLPGLRIMHDDYYFQMDLLIVTPHFFLILEIKNHAGHLYFDDKIKQMIRSVNGKVEAYEDPIEQVKRQSYHLEKIIEEYKLPAVPIERLIVISNSSTHVGFSPSYKEAFQRVIKSSQLPNKFAEYQQKYQEPLLTKKEISKYIKQLFKLHDAYDPDVCELFQINKSELMKGVYCQKCDRSFIMQYIRANWRCSNCGHTSKTTHVEALIDYALLISPTITNQQCKDFLNLPSRSITTHLLKTLNLPYEGSRKSRSYHLLPLLKFHKENLTDA
ncbi:NERD domain-containing protein [Fictibacillus nanhaiensis]|uniref:nuclease-related domain-containing protein n=1 Tax=Fictibacillus nanhaiensis TaxID=742169 RepID=UPI001C93B92B|nr:nuclease-related domain-containing protein [Fictibacillus nanhaiensis]MBY6036961.1 NERD domain-containing protein [Fictibacillus nanhaiensis]